MIDLRKMSSSAARARARASTSCNSCQHVLWAVFFRETRIACRCLEDRLCVRGVRISSAGAVWPEEKRSMMMIPSSSTLQRWSTSAPGRAARGPESRVCNARLGSARGGRLRGSGACFLAFPLWSRSGRSGRALVALVALWSLWSLHGGLPSHRQVSRPTRFVPLCWHSSRIAACHGLQVAVNE